MVRVMRVVVKVKVMVRAVVVYSTKSYTCIKSPAASLLLHGGDFFIGGTLHFTCSEAPFINKHTIQE